MLGSHISSYNIQDIYGSVSLVDSALDELVLVAFENKTFDILSAAFLCNIVIRKLSLLQTHRYKGEHPKFLDDNGLDVGAINLLEITVLSISNKFEFPVCLLSICIVGICKLCNIW
jgi:hypothetical protein